MLGQFVSPGLDFVTLATQFEGLPIDQLMGLASQGGQQGQLASYIARKKQAEAAAPIPGPTTMAVGAMGQRLPITSSITPTTNALRGVGEGFGELPADTRKVMGAAPPPTRPEEPDVSQMGIPSNTLEMAPPPAQVAPPTAPDPAVPQPVAREETPEDEAFRQDKWLAVMQAGLGMLSSRNPTAFGAIGEGGMMGLQAFADSKRDRGKRQREDMLLARQDRRDARQDEMAFQKMELEQQLAEQKMAMSREELDIQRQRYSADNPLNQAQIARDKAAAAASYASAARAKEDAKSGGSGGSGPAFFGNSGLGLAIADLVNSGKLTREQGAYHIATKTLPGPNGEIGVLRPGERAVETIREGGLDTKEKDIITKSDDAVASAGEAIDALRRAKELNNQAYSGAGAEQKAWLDRNTIGTAKGQATTEYDNLVRTEALAKLKATFGVDPAQSESKTMLDLAASINKSPEERARLLDNAMKVAEERRQKELKRAADVREGTYFQPGADPLKKTPSAAPPVATPGGEPAKTRYIYDPATGELKLK